MPKKENKNKILLHDLWFSLNLLGLPKSPGPDMGVVQDVLIESGRFPYFCSFEAFVASTFHAA